jgi:ABC-type dipeptide/oligopeptide/nickel transport system ATPase component
VADRVAVMYAGQVVEYCSVLAAFEQPLHPYTAGPQASLPKLGVRQDRLRVIPGTVPNPRDSRWLPLPPPVPGDD